MPLIPESETLKATKVSLEQLQQFKTAKLPRESELGVEFHFHEVIPHADRIVALYKQIPVSALPFFPDSQLNTLKTHADADLNRLNNVLDFKASQGTQRRTQIINEIISSYQGTFNHLFPLISYSISRTADLQELQTEARAMMQSIKTDTQKLKEDMEKLYKEASNILDEQRKMAAEQGVSQQAHYFHEESKQHQQKSDFWLTRTYWFSGALGIYAVLSLGVHKIPWLDPGQNTYYAVQLAISKVLIFAVLSFLLYLAARNHTAHKHNAVINKHRENALKTFTALVDAAKDIPNKDIILGQASSCIFAPQSSGFFSADGTHAPTAKSVVEFLSKPLSGE